MLLNVQLSPEHDLVKLAVRTGGGGGGGGAPPPMNAVYRRRFTVPAGTELIAPAVALLVNADATSAGVAEGFAER